MNRPKLQLDILMDAALATPNDIAVRSALADCLIESDLDEDGVAAKIHALLHEWEPETDDANPQFYCELCLRNQDEPGIKPQCSKALRHWINGIRYKLDEDYRKWKKLRDEHYEKNRLCRRWGGF